MQRAWSYKLYPTPAQAAALEAQLELHRLLYNAALEARKGAFDRVRWRYRYGTPAQRAALRPLLPTYASQNRELTLIRRDLPEYRALSSSAEQRTLRRLDKAFAAFFRRVAQGQTPGYPRFKARGRFATIEWTAGNGARLVGDRLHVQGVTPIKLRLYRPLPDDAVVKAIWVTRRASGWWCVLSLALPDPRPAPPELPPVGIDVGLRHFAALSDGETIAAPRPYEQRLKQLRRLQRHLSRQQRGSNRRAETVHQIARLSERIANQRRHFQRVLAADLARRYGLIAIEDRFVAAMTSRDRPGERYPWAKRSLNRGVHDAAWSQFGQILDAKAEVTGQRVVRVDPAGTSQACSACGAPATRTIEIFERWYDCAACGLHLDADVNSARLILQRALS